MNLSESLVKGSSRIRRIETGMQRDLGETKLKDVYMHKPSIPGG